MRSVGRSAGDQPGLRIGSALSVVRLRGLAEERGLAVREQETLLDLAAVGLAKLTWRNSPVEDWHSHSYRRIGQVEMMRANAATTRLVRACLPPSSRQAHAFDEVRDVIADGSRRLPDGRRLRDLAPSKAEYRKLTDEVRAAYGEWSDRIAAHGLTSVLLELACEAGRGSSRRWWLGPDWPAVVEEFVARLENPSRWDDPAVASWVSHTQPPADLPEPRRLGAMLLGGPDLLTPEWADYCLRAGVGAILPRWWESPSNKSRFYEERSCG